MEFPCCSGWDSSFEIDCKLIESSGPVVRTSNTFSVMSESEVQELEGGRVRWQVATGLEGLAQVSVQRLNSIGGVDHPADFGREREEGDDLFPA